MFRLEQVQDPGEKTFNFWSETKLCFSTPILNHFPKEAHSLPHSGGAMVEVNCVAVIPNHQPSTASIPTLTTNLFLQQAATDGSMKVGTGLHRIGRSW